MSRLEVDSEERFCRRHWRVPQDENFPVFTLEKEDKMETVVGVKGDWV